MNITHLDVTSIGILERQREDAMNFINHGCVRSIFLQGLLHIYRVHIDPSFKLDIHEPDFEETKRMLKELYEKYDAWLEKQKEIHP
jgi:hypothetical protein